MQSHTGDINHLQNAHGETLCGTLHHAASKDLVIVCHGFGWDKDRDLFVELCRSFQERSVNAFRFSFSGTSPSGGKPEDSSFTKKAEDLRAVVDYFIERGFRIRAVIAHSAGGTAAIIAAAGDPGIESLVLIAPRIDMFLSTMVKAVKATGTTLSALLDASDTVFPYPLFIRGRNESKTYYFSRKYLEELRDLDVVSHIRSLTVRTIIVRGSDDRKIAREEILAACDANALVTAVEIAGAGHTFSDPEHRKELTELVLQWHMEKKEAHYRKRGT